LSRRKDFFRGTGNVDLSESGQLLRANRTAAQDIDLASANSDNRRFNAMHSWSAIDDQWNATVQLIHNMLRGRGANAAEAICARSREWSTKGTNDFGENRMRTNSNCDRIQTRCHNFGND